MKTGEAAKLMGIDPKTIVNWIDRAEFVKYFSPTARKEGISQRILTDNDLALLNTIRHMTVNDRATWAEIAAVIESGELRRDIPENAAFVDTRMVPEPQVRESMRALAIAAERDQLAQRVEALQAEIAAERARSEAKQESLLRELADMSRRLGEYETELKFWRDGRLKPPKT